MFCPECKVLMFPKEGKMICKKCGAEQAMGDSGPQTIVEKRREKEEMAILGQDVSTLPTARAECDKCGNKNAYWIMRQTRASDEPETRIYRCTECNHTWREY